MEMTTMGQKMVTTMGISMKEVRMDKTMETSMMDITTAKPTVSIESLKFEKK